MKTETMLSLYRKNLNKLSEKHSEFFKNLKNEIEKFEKYPDGTDGEFFQWEDSPTPHKNFTYLRQNPPFHTKYCGVHPEAETQELLKANNLEHPSTVVIFGIGLGYGLKAFLKNRPHTNFCILVLEKNPQIFLRALCANDWTKEFEDETIHWILENELKELNRKFISFFYHNSTVDRYLKIIPTPAALASESEFYTEAAKSLLKTRDHNVLLGGNSIADQLLGLTNAVTNAPHCVRNPGITHLQQKFAGRLCISVAAGPSANEHFDTLRELQGKIPIFACESILKPLNDKGIYPDFVTAIERDDYVPKFFRNIKIHERTTLIAPMLLMKECFDLYQGSQLIFTPAYGWLDPIGLNFLGNFAAGSSTGNLNLTFAKLLGFKTIIMVGHNLAYGYQTHETHVRGTIEPDRERSRSEKELQTESMGLKSITQDGTAEVWSRLEWNLFKTQMEQFISNNPDTHFINTAPKGARILGTQLMTFKDALEKYKQEPFDIFPEMSRLLKPPSEAEVDGRIAQIKFLTRRTIESLCKWNGKGLELIKKLEKWEKKILDKELLGGQVSLDFLNDAIDEVLDLKVEAVNKDRHFYFSAITMIMPAHIVFERTLNEMRAHYKDDYSLKKDFLLKHKQYFNIWKATIPEITSKLETLLSHFEDQQMSAWSD